MRYIEIITEAVKARIDHPEDLVWQAGAAGAKAAMDALSHLSSDTSGTTVKWDGCIHPDSLIKTNIGLLRIEEVINRVNLGEIITVISKDLQSDNVVESAIINAVKNHGTKQWVSVELENGDVLTMTKDHEVYTTNRGWVAAGKLTEDDDVSELS